VKSDPNGSISSVATQRIYNFEGALSLLARPSSAMTTSSLSLGDVLFEYKTLFRALKPNLGYCLSPAKILGMDFRGGAFCPFIG
jgi:hypothetical protein